MEEPKALDSLFKEKIFRIPDYQRGYAWQREQLKDFWEDLINLSDGRSHYTGVLTLKEISSDEVSDSEKEYWLIDDHSYRMYHIVDGQQRLTTFIIFLQSFVDAIKSLPDNDGKSDEEIYITDSLTVSAIQQRFLFKIKPKGDKYRTYKFGYTEDNPSYSYLRHKVLGEGGSGTIQDTFYTLNLSNAKKYFLEQITEMYEREGMDGLQDTYKKLTKRFLFNEYIIKDEFDVFVAFETMNNRGKKLSDLELLKNRLIYLTTLYNENELDKAERQSMRDRINNAWKEVYYQLGRNHKKPLNDDDFLRAHWTMYFKYSRQTGQDYIRFLLDEQFTPQKIHKKVEREVNLEIPQEQRTDADYIEDENGDVTEEVTTISSAQLQPTEIRDYVLSLKESAVHWFRSYYPHLAEDMSDEERQWLDRLNRVGMVYFRPLIMSILKNVEDMEKRIQIFKDIERFIFIVFRLNPTRSNYGSSEFYNASRDIDQGKSSLDTIKSQLESRSDFTFNKDGSFWHYDFYNMIYKKFEQEVGYYGWPALRYFLYEYELSLLSQSRQKKVDWSDLLKTTKDKISIEHIYPQTETKYWVKEFKGVSKKERKNYNMSLGNFLLLSSSINSSLQNDSFPDKKNAKYSPTHKKLRNGYSDGSHSEIEVSLNESWGPKEIYERGTNLLKFMEDRWKIKFKVEDEIDERAKMLFLDYEKG